MAKLSIIVGTHGHFGEELVKSAELITGKMEGSSDTVSASGDVL